MLIHKLIHLINSMKHFIELSMKDLSSESLSMSLIGQNKMGSINDHYIRFNLSSYNINLTFLTKQIYNLYFFKRETNMSNR